MDSALPFQDAWARAKDRYVEDLTVEEKYVYHQATPETLFYDASAAQKTHQAVSTIRSISDKMQPFVSAVEHVYEAILIIPKIAREFGKYFEKLIEMFARIGDVLPRFNVYQRLFPNHERLVQALSVAYVDIIAFCSKCKSVFRQRQRSSLTSFKIAFKLTWKPFERQFGQLLDRFREHRKGVEKEAGISHMIEAADSRALIRANHLQLDEQRRQDLHQRILSMIPCVDHKTKQSKLQNLRYDGTGEWILQEDEFQGWTNGDHSSYLCCHGIPGSGKTILVSAIVDYLNTHVSQSKPKLMYYYCDYADQRTLQSVCIFGTLLKQLLSDCIPKELEKQMIEYFKNGTEVPAASALMQLVLSAIKLNQIVYLILDGLDECDKSTQEDIVALIDQFKASQKTAVRVLVTCRDEDQILRFLPNFSRIHITAVSVGHDIEAFIIGSVRSKIDRGKLRIRKPSLEQEIVFELISKAQGMFLWVFFQLDGLCEATSDAEVREILHNMPIGLAETYKRILEKIRRSKVKAEVALKVFKWIACAQRPLHIDELQEAVAFGPSDTHWDGDKIPHEDLMIEACQSLVVRDSTDSTLRFAHHTVQQFLHSEHNSGEMVPLAFQLDHAFVHVGRMCVAYLLFSDFQTQIARRKLAPNADQAGVWKPGGAALIPSILGMGKIIYDTVYRLSGGDSSLPTTGVDWEQYLKLRTTKKDPIPEEYANRYRLLQYVIDYWAVFTRNLRPEYLIAFRDLIENRQLPFEIRPWGVNQHFGPYGCLSCPGKAEQSTRDPGYFRLMSLFHYAAEIGHWSLMEPLVQDYCEHEKYTFQTFMIACHHGQKEVVKHLLKAFIHPVSRGIKLSHTAWQEALRNASFSGQLGIVEILLDRHVDRNLPRWDHNIEQELFNIAATNGHKDVVSFFLSNRTGQSIWVDIHETDPKTGLTALEGAAKGGYHRVVQKLLADDADLEANGLPALYLAVANHHPVVAECLLARRKTNGRLYIDALDMTKPVGEEGKPILEIAAQDGSCDVVKLILQRAEDPWHTGGRTANVIMSAFESAARNGHVDVLETMIQLERPSYDRRKLMIHAAENNHPSVIRWLIENGADAVPGSLQFYESRPLIQLALDKGHLGSLQYPKTRPLIQFALKKGHGDVVLVLLEHGARVHSLADLEAISRFGGFHTALCNLLMEEAIEPVRSHVETLIETHKTLQNPNRILEDSKWRDMLYEIFATIAEFDDNIRDRAATAIHEYRALPDD